MPFSFFFFVFFFLLFASYWSLALKLTLSGPPLCLPSTVCPQTNARCAPPDNKVFTYDEHTAEVAIEDSERCTYCQECWHHANDVLQKPDLVHLGYSDPEEFQFCVEVPLIYVYVPSSTAFNCSPLN
jgi:hypothetical protein